MFEWRGATKRRGPAATSWLRCKVVLKDWPVPGLISLLHELYNTSEENRRFLHARLLPQAADQTLAEAERAIKRLLSVSAAFNGRFRHADAKRVVDHLYATLNRLDKTLARLPPEFLVSRASRLNRLAERWGGGSYGRPIPGT